MCLVKKRNVARTLWTLSRRLGLGWLVLAWYPRSALVEAGWFRSYRRGLPVDSDGNPLPWLPYPLIDFLKARLTPDMSVFEYGCGNSTLWLCSRVKHVVAAENCPDWASRVKTLMPSGGKVILESDDRLYAETINSFGLFDLIVVDGINREACYQLAVRHLTERGVILADDSSRDDFRQSWPLLREQGFREITFSGLTPSHFVRSQATILYRDGNCLGI